jgi:hypothetical protein
LKQPELDAQLAKRGYAMIDLLTPDELRDLRAAYEQLGRSAPTGFHATMHSPDPSYRRRVYESITAVVREPIARHLVDQQIIIGNFIVKEPGCEDSAVQLHEDWSLVDPSRFRFVNIYIPLIDVDTVNGCLIVAPGSHRSPDWISPLPAEQLPIGSLTIDELDPYLESVPMKAGSALVYDGRLIHASRNNRSQDVRVACGCATVPAEAPITVYYAPNPETPTLEVIEVPPDFFFSYSFNEPQGGVRIGTIPRTHVTFTKDDFARWNSESGS